MFRTVARRSPGFSMALKVGLFCSVKVTSCCSVSLFSCCSSFSGKWDWLFMRGTSFLESLYLWREPVCWGLLFLDQWFSAGMILYLMGHLGRSGDIFACWNWGQSLLASSVKTSHFERSYNAQGSSLQQTGMLGSWFSGKFSRIMSKLFYLLVSEWNLISWVWHPYYIALEAISNLTITHLCGFPHHRSSTEAQCWHTLDSY